jgi:hypothetical protein
MNKPPSQVMSALETEIKIKKRVIIFVLGSLTQQKPK